MKVKVRAYCSSANLGSGFDVVAVALNAYYDVVEALVEKSEKTSVKVVAVEGVDKDLVGEVNTAKLAVEKLLSLTNVNAYVKLRVIKGIPVGKGLGSSGASAVAAVVAVTHALNLDVDVSTLLTAAGYGELASAGVAHYDNVAASLLGGLAVVIPGKKPYAITLGKPPGIFIIGVPEIPVSQRKTGFMRSILPKQISFDQYTFNSSRLVSLLIGAVTKNLKLIAQGMEDSIVEPARAPYVPCYNEVRELALKAGALGVALSGAGPSIIAITDSKEKAYLIANSILKGYKLCNLKAYTKIALVASKAEVLSKVKI